MLTGNLVSIAIGGIIAVVSSMIWPANFDFNLTRQINMGPLETYDGDIPGTNDENENAYETEKKGSSDDGGEIQTHAPKEVVDDGASNIIIGLPDDLDPVALQKAFNFAVWASVILVSTFREIDTFVHSPHRFPLC